LDITGIVAGQTQTPDLNKGLVYLYQRDLLVTGNFWNAVVNLDINWYRTKIDMINTTVTQIDFYKIHPRLNEKNNHVNWQEITHVHSI
jgi:hypothetical protein